MTTRSTAAYQKDGVELVDSDNGIYDGWWVEMEELEVSLSARDKVILYVDRGEIRCSELGLLGSDR